MKAWQWLVKGMVMGAADLVPGVSGGTMAVIMGVYARLLAALKSIDQHFVRHALRWQIKDAWQRIDGWFLLAIFSGVLLSVFSLSRLLTYLLLEQPIFIWSLFNGLILASLPGLLALVSWRWRTVLSLLLGVAFATFITGLTPGDFAPQWWMFFVAGFVAVSAMILPGISGAFILLLMGMYTPVLAAVKDFNIGLLALLLVGCVTGLLCSAHALTWLLQRYYALTLSFLLGIIIGALPSIWPFKLEEQAMLPWQMPEPFWWLSALLGLGLGALLLWLVKRLDKGTKQ